MRQSELEEVIHFIEGDDQCAEIICELANVLIEEELWEKAESIVRSIDYDDLKVSALRELMRVYIKTHPWNKTESMVREVIGSIKENDQKVEAFCELANALARSQQWERAEVAYTKAEEIARSIENSYQRVEAFLALTSALADVQQWERVEAIRAEAEKETEAYDYYKPNFLIDLAISLIDAQQWELAEKVASSIKYSHSRVYVLGKLVGSLTQVQNLERAEAIYLEAKEIAFSAEEVGNEKFLAISNLVKALVESRQWERVESLARSIDFAWVITVSSHASSDAL